jgi:hypothetical protein
MMQFFEGVLLLIFGVGILVIAWRGWRDGEIPAGSNFFEGNYKPSREKEPNAFYFFLILYVLGGCVLTLLALSILFGLTPPLKLR